MENGVFWLEVTDKGVYRLYDARNQKVIKDFGKDVRMVQYVGRLLLIILRSGKIDAYEFGSRGLQKVVSIPNHWLG